MGAKASGTGAGLETGAKRDSELRYTIYRMMAWEAGEKRRDLLRKNGLGAPYVALMDCIEEGWAHVRRLQEVCDTGKDQAGEAGVALFHFVEFELVDIFRWLAARCAECVPGPGYEEDPCEVSTDDIRSEGYLFARSLRVVELAVAHPSAPEELRATVREVTPFVLPWVERFDSAVVAVSEALKTDCRQKARARVQ